MSSPQKNHSQRKRLSVSVSGIRHHIVRLTEVHPAFLGFPLAKAARQLIEWGLQFAAHQIDQAIHLQRLIEKHPLFVGLSLIDAYTAAANLGIRLALAELGNPYTFTSLLNSADLASLTQLADAHRLAELLKGDRPTAEEVAKLAPHLKTPTGHPITPEQLWSLVIQQFGPPPGLR
jgi:hypothetical protein